MRKYGNRRNSDITHIIVISWWDGYESIKAFAGEDISIARYYEEDKKYLLEMEPYVQHYECYDFGIIVYPWNSLAC